MELVDRNETGFLRQGAVASLRYKSRHLAGDHVEG